MADTQDTTADEQSPSDEATDAAASPESQAPDDAGSGAPEDAQPSADASAPSDEQTAVEGGASQSAEAQPPGDSEPGDAPPADASDANPPAEKAPPTWEDYPTDHEGHTVVGTVKVMRAVHSPELGNERDILVYLPPSYGADAERRYPVLYMHDGQNLFDAATSFSGEWEVDQTLENASAEGLEAIVVGIPNAGPERLNEYSPFPDAKHEVTGRGDLYLDFMVRTLKPIIDRDFRTKPERGCTGIAGSSMGGLISLYAFFRNAETFGFAGVMSPALWFADAAILPYVQAARFAGGRVYVDVGTREGRETLGNVRKLRDILIEKGYRKDLDFLYVVEMGGTHTEAAWARRLRKELDFLLGGAASVESGGADA